MHIQKLFIKNVPLETFFIKFTLQTLEILNHPHVEGEMELLLVEWGLSAVPARYERKIY